MAVHSPQDSGGPISKSNGGAQTAPPETARRTARPAGAARGGQRAGKAGTAEAKRTKKQPSPAVGAGEKGSLRPRTRRAPSAGHSAAHTGAKRVPAAPDARQQGFAQTPAHTAARANARAESPSCIPAPSGAAARREAPVPENSRPERVELFDADPEGPTAPVRRGRESGRHAMRRLWMLCLLIALTLGGLTVWKKLGGMTAAAQAAQPQTAQSASAPAQEPLQEPVQEPEEKKVDLDSWELLLANTTHVLPQGFQPVLVSIGSGQQVDERIKEPLLNMFAAARGDGIVLIARSAFRSNSLQKTIFEQKIQEYMKKYGYNYAQATAGAKTWVNPPGTSEHETGLAIDIVGDTSATAPLNSSLSETAWARWLAANAADYGFILRYPKDKTAITGTSFEPWHYRYVGVENAQAIMSQGLCLEEYLDAAKAAQEKG